MANEMIKIDGVAIATPSEFKVEIADADSENSARGADGYLHRDRIAVKYKLYGRWKMLSNAEISIILKAVQNVFFTVEFPDPFEGTMTVKTFSVGNRTAPLYNFTLGKWEELSMNFTER